MSMKCMQYVLLFLVLTVNLEQFQILQIYLLLLEPLMHSHDNYTYFD